MKKIKNPLYNKKTNNISIRGVSWSNLDIKGHRTSKLRHPKSYGRFLIFPYIYAGDLSIRLILKRAAKRPVE